MSKYNRTTKYTSMPGMYGNVLQSDLVSTGRTSEGSPGYARDVKGELFVLAVSHFEGESSFYEKENDRSARFRDLVRSVAVVDPLWTWKFLHWLRTTANIRTAAIVGALEAASAMNKAKIPGGRGIVASVLVRADEPGEALAYWIYTRGRRIPKSVKRGVADAVRSLYTERNWLRWDSTRAKLRFADVIELVHPDPNWDPQSALFDFILNSRHGHKTGPLTQLPMIRNNIQLRTDAARGKYAGLLDRETLINSGISWEDALSMAGPEVSKAQLWTALIDTMGYMALLRNLRNFDQAGISDSLAQTVIGRLTDPAQVAGSRQFPFRFLAAYRAVQSLRWGHALETALNLSLNNIPKLEGRTLVLVDRSGSMFGTMSGRSELTRADQAAVFGSALALRNPEHVDLVEFGTNSAPVKVAPGEALLRIVDTKFHNLGGTYTRRAVQGHYRGHNRVIIVTDEQNADGNPGDAVPAHVPVYTWNLAGYQYSATPGQSRRYTFAGMTDSAWGLIPWLEAGESQNWPF